MATPRATRWRPAYHAQQKIRGVAFVRPVILLFVASRLYPMLDAIVLSFERDDRMTPPRWPAAEAQSR